MPTSGDAAVLRFLGRKVFFGVLVLLVPVLRDGPTPERLNRLCEMFAVSVRTVRRWCRFWRETFVTSRVWQAARGRFAAPVRAESMPGSLLGAFSEISDPESRVVAVLRLVSPIGGTVAELSEGRSGPAEDASRIRSCGGRSFPPTPC